MVVQHNLTAMNANRYLGINNSKLGKSLEKLSSGYAINRAGDNAAGLAVSEKMRSQIAGMTQGVKNAQDGISMVQTFEGALTETHSILQRMKTLADQMGNDSYDDPVDRKAAQQEFLQLNDELNQIADTDFNGVVVLNGGVMADGLEQVDGKFDYSMKADQVAAANEEALAKAQADAQAKIDNAQKNYDAAFNQYNAISNRDLCLEGNAVGWNTVDNSQYTKDAADALFGGINDVTDTAKTLTDVGVEEIDITYEYTEADGWKVKGGSYVDANGQAQEIAADDITAIIGSVTTTDNGGFIASSGTPAVGSSANADYGNAVLNTKDVAEGDVVTLKYTNSASSTYAPTNIGIDHDSLVNGVDKTTVPTLTLDADITDDNMTDETAAALDKLNKADISLMYSKDGITASISDKNLQISETAAGKYDISYKNAKGNTVKLATLETTAAHDASSLELKKSTATAKGDTVTVTGSGAGLGVTAAKTFTFDGTNWKDEGGTAINWASYGGTAVTDFVNGTPAAGDKLTLEIKAAIANGATGNIDVKYEQAKGTGIAIGGTAPTAAGSVTLTYDGTAWTKGGAAFDAAKLDGTNGSVTIEDAFAAGKTPTAGDQLTISWEANATSATVTAKPAEATVGEIKFGVALDHGNYDISGVKPTINPGKSEDGVDSSAIDKAFTDAKAALDEAKAAYPKTVDDLGEEYKVSKSDAFDNSEAIMTYKDNIILQVGARTKDAVNFTFKYDSDAIGDLAADLNCTAKGLGTDKLSIATQKDANFAVDKIDQAINKVSLIRGTFGAIQNRLEHKIDNMNVSIENLTSAESAIRDTNMPQEMMNFTKQQILAQASQSMLAQANQLPQGVLSLLQ